MTTVRLSKGEVSGFGRLPVGTVLDIEVPDHIEGEQEQKIRARKMMARDHPDESQMEWWADIAPPPECAPHTWKIEITGEVVRRRGGDTTLSTTGIGEAIAHYLEAEGIEVEDGGIVTIEHPKVKVAALSGSGC